jgi:hypothetical protein
MQLMCKCKKKNERGESERRFPPTTRVNRKRTRHSHQIPWISRDRNVTTSHVVDGQCTESLYVLFFSGLIWTVQMLPRLLKLPPTIEHLTESSAKHTRNRKPPTINSSAHSMVCTLRNFVAQFPIILAYEKLGLASDQTRLVLKL